MKILRITTLGAERPGGGDEMKRREDWFKLVAVIFFFAVVFISIFSAGFEIDALVYNGNTVPFPAIIMVAGALMTFFIWVLPSVAGALRRIPLGKIKEVLMIWRK